MPDIGRRAAQTLVILTVFAAVVVPAAAQSTALLDEDAGSTISATATVVGTAEGINFNETDTASAAVTGDMTLSLFPLDPPFDGVTLQAMNVSAANLNFEYCLAGFGSVCLAGADVVVTGLDITLLSPTSSDLSVAGDAEFQAAHLHITGTATVTGTGLVADLNETLPIDITTNATQSAVITTAGGVVTFTGLVFPEVSQVIPPEDLPSGVSALAIDLSVNAANVSFSGPHQPALLGDLDADADIDAADHAGFVECLAGPGAPIDIPCPLVDFDFDGDVDLMDYAAFVRAGD